MVKSPMSGISVCVFDAYGTLFDVSAIAGAGQTALGERAPQLADLWRRKQLEYTWLRSLMGRHTDFWHVTGESLDYAMKALSIDDPGLRAHLMEAYLNPTAYPDARDCLEGLKAAGHKLAILSNGAPSMLTSATKAADLDRLLDDVLSVESVGIYKPHPSAYRLVQDRFDCPASTVAFVSSNAWDAAGAAAFGFRVAWVNRGGLPREVLPASPHLEVTTLGELVDVLKP